MSVIVTNKIFEKTSKFFAVLNSATPYTVKNGKKEKRPEVSEKNPFSFFFRYLSLISECFKSVQSVLLELTARKKLEEK